MKLKNLLSKMAVILFASVMLIPIFGFTIDTEIFEGVNLPDIYKQIAVNFLSEQYEEQDIEYVSLSVEQEFDLYDYEEQTVAKAIVLRRDNEYDYIVLNLATSSIDEFAFGDAEALEKFSNKTYYAGLLNYYTKLNDNYYSLNADISLNSSQYKSLSQPITQKYNDFKSSASRKYRSGSNPLPNPNKDGYNGFYSWSQVDEFNKNNGYVFDDASTMPAVNPSGIGDVDLEFYSQNTFNRYFNVNNSCGPTALTNLCVYMNWNECYNRDGYVNALKNDSIYDTFERFRVLTKHSNTDGVYNSDIPNALITYANEQNYNYRIDTNLKTFSQFKENIDIRVPVVTFINLQTSDYFGHFVVSFGYKRFVYEYTQTHQFLWKKWTTTERKYTEYLRVVDGWGTSNAGRYIDFSGYWDNLIGTAFRFTV